jgi:hypothetical protein
MPDSAKDYLKEEQKQRRQEIENLIARNESDQRHGLIITGVIWSWLATNTKSFEHINFNIAIVTLPAVIMGFYFYRRRIIDKQIRTIAEYMRGFGKALRSHARLRVGKLAL